MDTSKEWYRSEFVSHEMLETHREIETEFTFYDSIVNGNMSYVEFKRPLLFQNHFYKQIILLIQDISPLLLCRSYR